MATWLAAQRLTTGGSVVFVLWLTTALRRRIRLYRDTRALEEWLWSHTEDEPGQSHRTVSELAGCLQLSEARVNRAVTHSRAIFRSAVSIENVSVWRQEPQHIAEECGLREL